MTLYQYKATFCSLLDKVWGSGREPPQSHQLVPPVKGQIIWFCLTSSPGRSRKFAWHHRALSKSSQNTESLMSSWDDWRVKEIQMSWPNVRIFQVVLLPLIFPTKQRFFFFLVLALFLAKSDRPPLPSQWTKFSKKVQIITNILGGKINTLLEI